MTIRAAGRERKRIAEDGLVAASLRPALASPGRSLRRRHRLGGLSPGRGRQLRLRQSAAMAAADPAQSRRQWPEQRQRAADLQRHLPARQYHAVAERNWWQWRQPAAVAEQQRARQRPAMVAG